jgi:hypothetical protein
VTSSLVEVSGKLHVPVTLPQVKEPVNHWIGTLVSPRSGLGAEEKSKILPCREWNPGPLARIPTPSNGLPATNFSKISAYKSLFLDITRNLTESHAFISNMSFIFGKIVETWPTSVYMMRREDNILVHFLLSCCSQILVPFHFPRPSAMSCPSSGTWTLVLRFYVCLSRRPILLRLPNEMKERGTQEQSPKAGLITIFIEEAHKTVYRVRRGALSRTLKVSFAYFPVT